MIKEWSVSNFKSIRDEARLGLKPLTILAGSNSSGKSSFIQSMLMVSQTLSHKVDNRAVVLNGALTDLGQLDDLRFANGAEGDVRIGFKCEPMTDQAGQKLKKLALTSKGPIYYGPRSTGLDSIDCQFSFGAGNGQGGDGSRQSPWPASQPHLLSARLSCSPRSDPEHSCEITVAKRDDASREVGGCLDEDDALVWSEGLGYEVALDEGSNGEIKTEYMSAHPEGCLFRHFLPRRIIYAINASAENANALTQALQFGLPEVREYRNSALPEPMLTDKVQACLRETLIDIFDINEIFPKPEPGAQGVASSLTLREWYEGLLSIPPEQRIRAQKALLEDEGLFARIYDLLSDHHHGKQTLYIQDRPPENITLASWYLSDFFSNSLRYLAPLRSAPKSLYPQSSMASATDIGTRGENTASILEAHHDRHISYIPSSAFSGEGVHVSFVTATLGEAVAEWMNYLGLASEVLSRDLGKVGHSLQVALDGKADFRDLTHVGVGVSQALPVLVLGLVADPGSSMVLEQPELHLHPKTQSLLADFLLSMALSDKQFIVETHSEYIVDRIRYRIAASGNDSPLHKASALYFVERSDEGSSFREVTVNDYGAIEDWPKGFFDESCHQAADILLAAHKKRAQAKPDADA